MIPANDPWQPKVWGKTRCVAYGQAARACQAQVVEGGFSSRHRHPDQTNTFFVLSGRLRVEVWEGAQPVGVPTVIVTLTPNALYTAPLGLWHRFVALTPVALVETYERPLHPAEGPPPPDIERYDEGGVGDPKYGLLHEQ